MTAYLCGYKSIRRCDLAAVDSRKLLKIPASVGGQMEPAPHMLCTCLERSRKVFFASSKHLAKASKLSAPQLYQTLPVKVMSP